jgi:tocopherol cyclase
MRFLALVPLAFSLTATLALAKPDPFNALVWNRGNHLAQNGKVDRGDWFEWWYYKVTVPGTDQAFLFYYGVVNPWDAGQENAASKSFVGFGSYTDGALFEEAHPVSHFEASYDETKVRIGGNQATDKRIRGKIQDAKTGKKASWDMTLSLDWKFNAMGWSTSVPDISNIYWYPAQASARMSGKLTYDGKTYVIKDAPAYQDRNWGRSYPKWWTWLVSNHFEGSPGTALAAGGGNPTLFGGIEGVEGLMIGFRHEGKVYSFRKSDQDPMDLDIEWGKWEATAHNKFGERIEISAYAPPEKFMILPLSTPEAKIFYDYEALKGWMRVRLSRWRAFPLPKWEVIADVQTNEAGIEWGTPTLVNP